MAAWNEFVRRRYPGDFLQLLLNRGPFTYCVSQNGGFVDTLSSAMIINCRPPLPADVICEQPITLELELIWYGCSWDIGRFQYFHTNNRLLATTCIHKIATFFNSSYVLVYLFLYICVYVFVFLCIFMYLSIPPATCIHKLSTFSNYWLKSASKAHHWLAGVLWAQVRLKWGDRKPSIIADVHYFHKILSNEIYEIVHA